MRLLTTFSEYNDAQVFSRYLTQQGIDNTIEAEKITDWGSPFYGTNQFKFWIIDEDHLEHSSQYLEQFRKDPKNSAFNNLRFEMPIQKKPEQPSYKRQKSYVPAITGYLVAICALFFLLTSYTSPEFKTKQGQSYSPIYTSPIKQKMLYDFPKAFEILDELVTKYGLDTLQNSVTLQKDEGKLVQAYYNTPYWQGIYEEAISYLTTGFRLPKAPLFEKIRKGEIWRLFTPIFLHGDIFHLLFNMAWLYILGKQMEIQLKPLRYIIFILITAIFTNTAQYLMSGPNFIGFSGVICAMLAYIWQRQQTAPWEGYQLQQSTFNFMMIFIFGMVVLQTLAFLLEVTIGQTIPTSIANAAHVLGLGTGWVLAKVPFFTERQP